MPPLLQSSKASKICGVSSFWSPNALTVQFLPLFAGDLGGGPEGLPTAIVKREITTARRDVGSMVLLMLDIA